jgi:phosphopantetheinyl transferase (holo-ACP synthase)
MIIGIGTDILNLERLNKIIVFMGRMRLKFQRVN